jgi:hypothetical protein
VTRDKQVELTTYSDCCGVVNKFMTSFDDSAAAIDLLVHHSLPQSAAGPRGGGQVVDGQTG